MGRLTCLQTPETLHDSAVDNARSRLCAETTPRALKLDVVKYEAGSRVNSEAPRKRNPMHKQEAVSTAVYKGRLINVSLGAQ